MTLTDIPSYCTDHVYVVKLHRDARPRDGLLKGRLEHVSSGECRLFASGEELVRAISQMGARP